MHKYSSGTSLLAMNLRKPFLFTPSFPVLQGRQYHPCSWWYLAAIAAWMLNASVTDFLTSHCNRWLFPVKEVTTHCYTPTCMLRTRLPRDIAPPAIFSSFHPKQGRGQKGTRLNFYKLEDNESSALCSLNNFSGNSPWTNAAIPTTNQPVHK